MRTERERDVTRVLTHSLKNATCSTRPKPKQGWQRHDRHGRNDVVGKRHQRREDRPTPTRPLHHGQQQYDEPGDREQPIRVRREGTAQRRQLQQQGRCDDEKASDHDALFEAESHRSPHREVLGERQRKPRQQKEWRRIDENVDDEAAEEPRLAARTLVRAPVAGEARATQSRPHPPPSQSSRPPRRGRCPAKIVHNGTADTPFPTRATPARSSEHLGMRTADAASLRDRLRSMSPFFAKP